MSTVRVIAGMLKGKPIPFINKKFNHADITTQKVKEAFFSIIGEDLSCKSFLDLFSGSGQMGIEALSRGGNPVVFNEIDRKRYGFINEYVDSLSLGSESIVTNLHAERAIRWLSSRNMCFNIVYVDPPYDKRKGTVLIYGDILEKIDERGILHENGIAAVQHFSDNKLPETAGRLKIVKYREYGKSALSLYGY